MILVVVFDMRHFRDLPEHFGHPEVSENDKDNNYSLDTEAATLNMKYDINENLTLVSVTGHRQVNEYRIYDFDASAAPLSPLSVLMTMSRPVRNCV